MKQNTFAATLAAILLAACGGGGGGSAENTSATNSSFDRIVEPVIPAVDSGPYRAALADCAFNAQRAIPCTLNELPFLGQSVPGDVTVDDVMARVITSKPWMARRLRELLQTLPVELLQMMKPVRAIVVAGKIRPAFYSTGSGAMYIDPAYLWTTPAEWADVDKSPDYRTDYGDGLQVATLWRYVKNNDYIYKWNLLDPDGSRAIADLKLPFAALMFHELTHAGDHAPPALLASISKDQPLPAALAQIADRSISSTLYKSSPLLSPTWKGLAQVMYGGAAATPQQKAMTAAQVGAEFEAERATVDYAYFTPHEDVALLVEEALMGVYYSAQRDFAVTPLPTAAHPTLADYIVTWGTRGRIGQPKLKQAAALVLSQLLPNVDLRAALDALPPMQPLPAGVSWASSLALGAPADTPASADAQAQGPGAERPVEADRPRPHRTPW